MITAARWVRAMAAAGAIAVLSSCGGSPAEPGVNAQTCSRNNPYLGDATSPTRAGSLGTEKSWLRDYIDRKYLWYDKVPAIDADAPLYSNDTLLGFYESIDNYFLDLTQPLTNPPGKPVDRFSFTYPTAAWDTLINSGSSVGYGIEWLFGSETPPRDIRVAYVHAGSTAATQGIRRGDTLVLADNVSADDNTPQGVATLNAALYPAAGTNHSFRFTRAGSSTPIDVTMTAGDVALTSVESRVLDVGGQRVGYILFNDHVLTSEQPLINAFNSLRAAPGVTDLVLDLRYNGGGYLFIASEVGAMVAGGPSRPALRSLVFESTQFNSKRRSEDATTYFEDRACLPNPQTFNCTSNAPLPTLNLSRVYVLVGPGTCSASEAIVNALRGIDVEVHLIGSNTCGKPYGFFGQDNCGITYFPIEFQGVNAKGFGDYAGGFVPGGGGVAGVAGCAANDDLDHALGDPAEGQLAAALSYRASNNTACLPLMASPRTAPLATGQAAHGRIAKPVALTNRNGRLPAR